MYILPLRLGYVTISEGVRMLGVLGRLRRNLIANYIFMRSQFRANGRRSEGTEADNCGFPLL